MAYNQSFFLFLYWAWNPLNQFTNSDQVPTLPLFIQMLQLFSYWLHLLQNFLFTISTLTHLLLTFRECINIQNIPSDWLYNLHLYLQSLVCKSTRNWSWTILDMFCLLYTGTDIERNNTYEPFSEKRMALPKIHGSVYFCWFREIWRPVSMTSEVNEAFKSRNGQVQDWG